jgi:hypothetical protein
MRIIPADPLLLRIRRARLRLRRALADSGNILSTNAKPKTKRAAGQRVIDLHRHLKQLEAEAREHSIDIPMEWDAPSKYSGLKAGALK